MAADTVRPANVQAYLDKHKISSLFESLTSQLVKELPTDPLGFLILKLQGLKKKVPAATNSKSSGIRKPLPSSAAGRKPIPASSSSSAASTRARPVTAGTTGIAKPPSASTRPSSSRDKPTAASTSSSSRQTAPSDTKASIKSAPATTSRIPRSPIKPVKGGASGKTSTAVPSASGAKLRKPGPVSTPSTTRAAVSKTRAEHDKQPTKPPTTKEKVPKPTVTAKKVDDDEDNEEVLVLEQEKGRTVDMSDSDEEQEFEQKQSTVDYDDEEEEEEEEEEDDEKFDINQLVQRMKRSKGPGKRHQHRSQEFIASLLSHGSSGYQSEDEWEEEEEEEGVGLDVAESATMLEEEGVVVGEQSRTISKQLPRPDPVIDLQVMVCARCASVIGKEDQFSLVSSTQPSSQQPQVEFESASQVGSQVTFPQWNDSTSTVTGTIESNVSQPPPPPSSLDESDAATDVTVPESHDTWQGLAPPLLPGSVPTDESSELQLPNPVGYEKPPPEEDDEDEGVEEGEEDL